MQELGGEQSELVERMARLEAELRAQREEMAALREQMRGLTDSDSVIRPRKPAYVPPFAPAQSTTRTETTPVAAEAVSERVAGPPPPLPPPPPRGPLPPKAVPEMAFGGAAVKAGPQRSLENRIGSQWFARVGVLALLIGVAWFLKLAYDNHWIHTTPYSRVAIGLLLGAGVVLWSERFRRKGYAAFSYALKAVGSGTLYLALWASFHLYRLLPAWVALAMMVGVTAWNAWMAWSQDAELLAAYALLGGFATPMLLSTGENSEVFLFTYLLAMALAVVFLLAKKPWWRLLLGSFPGTVAYFIGWYSKFWDKSEAGVTALFVVLLGAPFVAVALVGKQREDAAEGVWMPLGAATFVSLSLYSVLEDSGRHAWLPWAAVALAAVYVLLMRVRREGLAVAMHLVIAIVLLTVAIPLKAEGRWLTIGWLAEGVALLWVVARVLGDDTQPRVRVLMRWLGFGALMLGVVESVVRWYSESAATAFWNARFATEMFAVAALSAAAWMAGHPVYVEDEDRELSWPGIAAMSVMGAHVVAPLAVLREIGQYWDGLRGPLTLHGATARAFRRRVHDAVCDGHGGMGCAVAGTWECGWNWEAASETRCAVFGVGIWSCAVDAVGRQWAVECTVERARTAGMLRTGGAGCDRVDGLACAWPRDATTRCMAHDGGGVPGGV